MSNITREQAVAQVGEDLVSKVEQQDLDFSNRVIPAASHRNGDVEFSASVRVPNSEGFDGQLDIFVFVPEELVAECDDLSTLNWKHYIRNCAEYRIR